MRYTSFQNHPISKLGFGLMRLPLKKGTHDIDQDKAEAMVLEAVRQGVNYFDTAYNYHEGKSETFLGEIVKRHNLREKIFVADKMPSFQCDSLFEAYRITATQLERTGFAYFDFYLLHSLNRTFFQKALKLGWLDYMAQLKKDGIAKHLGFSFHDDFAVFKEIIDAFDWDFCQIQLNITDQNFQAGLKGLAYAEKKGIPVVIMEPLKGGKLTSVNVKEIGELQEELGLGRVDMPSLCLRWLYEQPNILTVLSGMSEMEHVQQNCRTAANPEVLSNREHMYIDRFRTLLRERIPVACTGCGYCEEKCPGKMDIAAIFQRYNDAVMLGQQGNLPSLGALTRKGCTQCGLCNSVCPQHLPVREKLHEAMAFLGANNQ